MMKKLTLLAMSVAALVAFAVPATASATPLLHNAEGEGVESVEAISENTFSTTTAGTLECQTVILNINVSSNSTTTAEGSGGGEAHGTKPSHTGPCYNPQIGQHVVVTDVRVNSLHLANDGTGDASFEFDFDIPAFAIKCTVGGTVAIAHSGSELSINGTITPLISGCPSGAIHGDFTLQNGATIG